jgi:hypothetical protein
MSIINRAFALFLAFDLFVCPALADGIENASGSGGGGSGTVTSISVVTANGISGIVANPTTTPAITVTLGAITPSSVAIGVGSAITSSGPGGVLGTGAFAAAAPCSAFGTASGTCAQGGVITAGGPTGSATVAPIITYNAAGQLTAVSSATITPAVGSITGLGTNVATALGQTLNGSGAISATTSPTFVTPALGAATGTSIALGGCTLGSQVFCETGAASLNGVETILSGGNIGFGTETNPQAAFVFSANTTTGITLPATTSGIWSISANTGGNVPGFNALAFATNGSNFFFRADGTAASPTALALNDNIGAITWGGYAGSTAGYVASKARIAGIVTDASGYGTSTQGTGIEFDTTPSGSTTRAQAGRFMAGFVVGPGTTDPGAGNAVIAGRSTLGSATAAVGQSGDVAQIKETDAAAAPGAGYAVLKWVAGSGTSCNLIAYAGTSATPVTIASTVGSGC